MTIMRMVIYRSSDVFNTATSRIPQRLRRGSNGVATPLQEPAFRQTDRLVEIYSHCI